MGATLVLPFAGLEIMLVSIGFYLNFKWSRQKEVISISSELVKVEKGSLIKNFEWKEFRTFVKALGIPTVLSLPANGVLHKGDSNCVGMVGHLSLIHI